MHNLRSTDSCVCVWEFDRLEGQKSGPRMCACDIDLLWKSGITTGKVHQWIEITRWICERKPDMVWTAQTQPVWIPARHAVFSSMNLWCFWMFIILPCDLQMFCVSMFWQNLNWGNRYGKIGYGWWIQWVQKALSLEGQNNRSLQRLFSTVQEVSF